MIIMFIVVYDYTSGYEQFAGCFSDINSAKLFCKKIKKEYGIDGIIYESVVNTTDESHKEIYYD